MPTFRTTLHGSDTSTDGTPIGYERTGSSDPNGVAPAAVEFLTKVGRS